MEISLSYLWAPINTIRWCAGYTCSLKISRALRNGMEHACIAHLLIVFMGAHKYYKLNCSLEIPYSNPEIFLLTPLHVLVWSMCLVSNGCTNHTSWFTDSQHCMFSMFYCWHLQDAKPELPTPWKTSGQCNKHVTKTSSTHNHKKSQSICQLHGNRRIMASACTSLDQLSHMTNVQTTVNTCSHLFL